MWDGEDDARAAFASALSWWADAGVATLADDAPRDWLQPSTGANRSEVSLPPVPPPTAAPAAATLAALHAWLASTAEVPGPIAGRIAPAGDAAAGLMIVVDMPEEGDAESGRLLSGPSGRLLDRMLAAIGRDRASVYLAPLSPARAVGGRIAAADSDALAAIMRRHVALAGPRAVLLLGDGASAALLGASVARARGGLRELNHHGGTVAAVSTFHPRFLIGSPARKAEAWKDLRLLLQELARRC